MKKNADGHIQESFSILSKPQAEYEPTLADYGPTVQLQTKKSSPQRKCGEDACTTPDIWLGEKWGKKKRVTNACRPAYMLTINQHPPKMYDTFPSSKPIVVHFFKVLGSP